MPSFQFQEMYYRLPKDDGPPVLVVRNDDDPTVIEVDPDAVVNIKAASLANLMYEMLQRGFARGRYPEPTRSVRKVKRDDVGRILAVVDEPML